MPAKNHLTPEQVEKLQRVLKEEENGDIRERILMLLLLNDGKTQAQIAIFLGCSINKVSYWCVHGGEHPTFAKTWSGESIEGSSQS